MARKVIVSRDVTFDESAILYLPNKQMHWNDDDGRGGTDLVATQGDDITVCVNDERTMPFLYFVFQQRVELSGAEVSAV